MPRFSAIATTLTALAATTCLTAPALAEDSFPHIEGEIPIEIQNDYTYDSDDRDAELNDLYRAVSSVVQSDISRQMLSR